MVDFGLMIQHHQLNWPLEDGPTEGASISDF